MVVEVWGCVLLCAPLVHDQDCVGKREQDENEQNQEKLDIFHRLNYQSDVEGSVFEQSQPVEGLNPHQNGSKAD